MKLNYQNIIRIVSNNLGKSSPTAKDVSVIKMDLYSVLLDIYRKAEPVKSIYKKNITTKMSEIMLPDDFFVAHEVIFRNNNKQTVLSKELTEEEYYRWNSDATIENEQNFEKVAVDSPLTLAPYTEENYEFDGKIGYYFTDTDDVSLFRWKPAINGTVGILYSTTPDNILEGDDLSDPRIHKSFVNLLIAGATVKGLLRMKPRSEIELNDKVLQLRMYRDEFKEELKNFAGYINRQTNTPYIKNWDFLNFPDDIIYG